MEKFIGIAFDSEAAAFRGAVALQELHKTGELAVYAAGIIAKDASGHVELKQPVSEGTSGAALGLALGAVVGVLGGAFGPVSGLAAAAGASTAAQADTTQPLDLGPTSGGVFGAYRDLWASGANVDMLERVYELLGRGKACIFASVEELDIAALNMKMKEYGGTVHRRPRVDLVEEEIQAEIVGLTKELAAMEDALAVSQGETFASIETSRDRTKTILEEAHALARARLVTLQNGLEARLTVLDELKENATPETRAKILARKQELAAEYQARMASLETVPAP